MWIVLEFYDSNSANISKETSEKFHEKIVLESEADPKLHKKETPINTPQEKHLENSMEKSITLSVKTSMEKSCGNLVEKPMESHGTERIIAKISDVRKGKWTKFTENEKAKLFALNDLLILENGHIGTFWWQETSAY